MQWNVSLLGNGKYTIKNLQQASFANAGNRASAGATVEGRAQQQQWEIQETRVKGQYTFVLTLASSNCLELTAQLLVSPLLILASIGGWPTINLGRP